MRHFVSIVARATGAIVVHHAILSIGVVHLGASRARTALLALVLIIALVACGNEASTTLEAPTNVTATPGPGYVTVSWQHDGQHVTGFRVSRQAAPTTSSTMHRMDDASTETTFDVGPDFRSYDDGDIDTDATVLYSVRALGAGGVTSSATTQSGPAVQAGPPAEVTVTWITSAAAASVAFAEGVAQRYADANPHKIGVASYDVSVDVVAGPGSATDRLAYYLDLFGDASDAVDVLEIDVVWPGDLAEYLVDLGDAQGVAAALPGFFASIVENNTVDGRLVALPYYADAGMLYYRSDLLDAYAFSGPPTTWDDLEAMAATIQEGERTGGNADFWGFVWQGNAYEGLTANALEWVHAHAGGQIVEPDGVITIDNPNAVAALERATGWVGTISPSDVTMMAEESSRSIWQSGNAAFMRNWPYAYGLGNAPGSAVADQFGIVPLPAGNVAGGTPSGALGGWQLAVSAYSAHPEVAADLALFISSHQEQLQLAIELSFLPTRAAVYDDPQLLGSTSAWMADALPIFESAVARPSTVTAPNYGQTSALFYGAVHDVLTGTETAGNALAALAQALSALLDLPTGQP